MKKIFLIGSERSGTNLLRVLLGNHSQISAPPPIHVLDLFENRTRLLRPDTKDAATKLARNLESYVNHTFSDWQLSLPSDVVEKLPQMCAVEVMDMLYRLKAEADGCSAYFNKDNHLHKFAPGVLAHVPDARFVWIYRNPLDQVASWMKTPVHFKTPYAAAHKWKNDQMVCARLGALYGIPVHPVSYEALIADTAGEVAKVLEFTGLPMEEACGQTSGENREARKHVLWENLDKPVMRGNHGKYAEHLSAREIEMTETICKDMMTQLGYEFVSNANYSFGNRYAFALRNRLSRRKLVSEKGVETILSKKALVKKLFG